jgi:hypothetical protein
MKSTWCSEIELPIIGWCLVATIACSSGGGKHTSAQQRFYPSVDSSPAQETPTAGATRRSEHAHNQYDGNIIPPRWRIGETEGAPLTEMLFGATGQFSLEGGFQQWSPGSWRYDSAGARLSITLPRILAHDLALFTQNAESSNIISVDTIRKVVVYHYAPDTTHITFAGYNFFPVRDTTSRPQLR